MRSIGTAEFSINAALQVENTEKCHPPLTTTEVTGIAASIARYEPASEVSYLGRDPVGTIPVLGSLSPLNRNRLVKISSSAAKPGG